MWILGLKPRSSGTAVKTEPSLQSHGYSFQITINIHKYSESPGEVFAFTALYALVKGI